ncbi:MAG TPA: hypothetical protein VLV83_15350 [Acidobacteriota bacterium]|nr:hypothetical protein [Acidobacteriota bacterium]
MKTVPILAFAFLSFTSHLPAQQAPSAIGNAHGIDAVESGSTILVEGTATVGEQAEPFTLYLREGDSRLQLGDQVVVHAEGLRQKMVSGRPGRVEFPFPGLRDSFLMPFWSVGRLGGEFTPSGREAGRDRFRASEKRRRFVAAPPENHEVLLEFEAQTGLMSGAAIVSPQDQPDVSYLYSDYRRVEGLQVSHRVERRLAGRTVLVLEVEAVDLHPRDVPSDFHIVHPVPSSR